MTPGSRAVDDRLERIAGVACEIRIKLASMLDRYVGRVHLRPTENGITLVGLHRERPQRGRGKYTASELSANFDAEYRQHCVDISQGRPTPEKELQAFVISEAYRAGRCLRVLRTSGSTSGPFDPVAFVTDELALLTGNGKFVCDLLAVRREADRVVPLIVELKTERAMTRLARQLSDFARLIESHRPAFERLYSAVLGAELRFTHTPEKWLLWPEAGHGADPREQELADQGIGVVQYAAKHEGYRFHVGPVPLTRSLRPPVTPNCALSQIAAPTTARNATSESSG